MSRSTGEPLELGKRRISRGTADIATGERLHVAIELSTDVNHEVILDPGVTAAGFLGVETHAHDKTIAEPHRLSRRLGNRGIAHAGRIVEISAQMSQQLRPVAGRKDVAGLPHSAELLRRALPGKAAAAAKRHGEDKDGPAQINLRGCRSKDDAPGDLAGAWRPAQPDCHPRSRLTRQRRMTSSSSRAPALAC